MSAPSSQEPRRAIDVDLAALLLLGVGLLGLAGCMVSVVALDDTLVARVMLLAALMVGMGYGLWQRLEWMRRAVVVVSVLVIHGQMARRWLQSEVPHALLDSLRGVVSTAPDGGAPYSSALVSLPPPEVGPAAFSLVLCMALGWLMLRLLSSRVRQEFDPLPIGRLGSPQKV